MLDKKISYVFFTLTSCSGVVLAQNSPEGGCTGYSIPLNTHYRIFISSGAAIACERDWTHAAAYAVAFDAPLDPDFGPDCKCTDIDVDADAGFGFSSASASACRYEPAGTGAYGTSLSQVTCDSLLVTVDLKVTGILQSLSPECFSCPTSSLSVGAGAAGAELVLSSAGQFVITVLDLSPWGSSSIERLVSCAIVCIEGSLVAFAAETSVNQIVNSTTMAATGVDSGTRSISAVHFKIMDAHHDLTGDGRFNQADIDVLQSIIGTPAAMSTEFAKFDFINAASLAEDDGVQQDEVDLLQCFVDAGLSSGLLGDANQNGQLDCGDIALAFSHFNNYDSANNLFVETFPNSDYLVELDADLDGDNDQDDYVLVIAALRHVEPANFFFDDVLNFFDTNAFLALYNASDPRADIYPVGNPDGNFNFFDLNQFASYFANPKCQ